MDFTKLKEQQVKSSKLIFKMEIELNESLLTDQEAADRLAYASNRAHDFSAFILFLLRETRSSTYELKKLEIIDCPS